MKFVITIFSLTIALFASNLDKILTKQAIQSHKMILIEATSDYCGYCIKMKKEVLSDKEVKEAISKKFIFKEVLISSEKLPFKLDSEFGGMTPTFFILDEKGKLIKQIPGSWGKKDFLDFLSK